MLFCFVLIVGMFVAFIGNESMELHITKGVDDNSVRLAFTKLSEPTTHSQVLN
jgi:hypothetical protein